MSSLEWTPGVGEGQGGLACCDSWGRKEPDTTERLIWSDLITWERLRKQIRKQGTSLIWPTSLFKDPVYAYVLVAQSGPSLCDSVDCSPPGPSDHGILWARILEWVVIPFSRGPSWPRIEPGSPALQVDSLILNHFWREAPSNILLPFLETLFVLGYCWLTMSW